jgi:hypothetical protein
MADNAYDYRCLTERDKKIREAVVDLDVSDCHDELIKAIKILREYPKGQSDGAWIKHRQWFLENFIPEEECT